MSSPDLLIHLIKRREDLCQAVFTFPPSTWEEFHKRLGQHAELSFLIDEIEGRNQQESSHES